MYLRGTFLRYTNKKLACGARILLQWPQDLVNRISFTEKHTMKTLPPQRLSRSSFIPLVSLHHSHSAH